VSSLEVSKVDSTTLATLLDKAQEEIKILKVKVSKVEKLEIPPPLTIKGLKVGYLTSPNINKG